MNDSHVKTIQEIKEFIKVANNIEFQGKAKREKYTWIEGALDRFGYFRLKKGDKSILKAYMTKLTGYSDAQMTRLVTRKRKTGKIILVKPAAIHSRQNTRRRMCLCLSEPTKLTSGFPGQLP